MEAAAQTLPKRDERETLGEDTLKPTTVIRRVFNASIREYCSTRLRDGITGNISTFLGRLSDSCSYEHTKNFFLFCLVLSLREAFSELLEKESCAISQKQTPIFLVTATEHKLKTDLSKLLATREWSLNFLREAANGRNIVAKQIIQTISYLGLLNGSKAALEDDATMDLLVKDRAKRGEANQDSGREKNLSANSLTGDILAELRLRLRRGQLWRDDPWWPQAAEEDL